MIDYVEITVAKLETALPERIEELHLAPRRSPKGGKVLIKLQHYKDLFKEEVEEQLASIPMTLDENGEPTKMPDMNCISFYIHRLWLVRITTHPHEHAKQQAD